ncbi:hypothetical protein ACIODT_38810 [Streptomyces sp. NPDC088251]|uniref:hypothetical protein n=1 Tax=unclassified Streptomyces TaxID=2593676 RepID=UPI003817CC7B
MLITSVAIVLMEAVSSSLRFARKRLEQEVGRHVSRLLAEHAQGRLLSRSAGCGSSCLAEAGVSRHGGRGQR